MQEFPSPDHFDLVLVVTPWYPTAANPVWGSFVQSAVVALKRQLDEPIQVVHVDGSELSPEEIAEGRGVESWSYDEIRDEAPVRVIRTPFPPSTPRSTAMEIHRAALTEHATDLIERAKYVSAHVGGPTAAAIAPLLQRRTRFTITEHATYVRGLFQDTAAAIQYRAAVSRAARVLAVSDETANTLRQLCPEQSDRISAVANPVDFDRLPLREESTGRSDRWLFVGNLVERKGVHRLLAAFEEEVRDQDASSRLHLTLVGDGPMRPELEEFVETSGLRDRVTFLGSLHPADVPPLFGDHDVLVHLATHETFGLTLVEAAATGLPVVVTRCGGPQETMIVPEGLGLCVFVPRSPEPHQVRAAVHAVRTDAPRSDLEEAREMLRTFYGQERSADLQSKYVLGRVPAAPLATPLDLSLLVIFQGTRQWQRLRHGADRAADLGVRITAVDLDDKVATVPAGIQLVNPGAPDRYNAVRTLERTLVDRAPATLLRTVGHVLPRLPQPAARPALRGLTAAERLHRKVSAASQDKLYRPAWKLLRGQVIARRVEQQPELHEIATLDVLVHMGGRMTQLAYRMAMRHPEAALHQGAFSAAHLARWWVRSRARSVEAAAEEGH